MDFYDSAKNFEWSIRAGCHTYVSLYYYGQFVYCYDNDMEYAEEIISSIEKLTKMKISDIPLVDCSIDDFSGFRFLSIAFCNLLLNGKNPEKGFK